MVFYAQCRHTVHSSQVLGVNPRTLFAASAIKKLFCGVQITLDKQYSRRTRERRSPRSSQQSHYLSLMNCVNVFSFPQFERFVNSLLADNKDLADAVTADGLARAISNVEWTEKYGGPITSFLQDQQLVNDQ